MKKRILAIMMSLVMLVGLMPVTAMAEDAMSGTCGDNATWSLTDEDGDGKYTLEIFGSGAMTNYTKATVENANPAPWENYRTYITKVILSDDITEVGSRTLSSLAITELSLPKNLTKIHADSIRNNTELKSIVIPDGVTEIGGWAFAGDTSLESIVFSEELSTLGTSVFENCNNVENINISESCDSFKVDNNVLFNKEGTKLMYYPAANKASSYTVPAGVTTIGQYAFQNTVNLTELVIGTDVTILGAGALRNCTSIENLTLGENIISADGTLAGLSSLETLNFNCKELTVNEDRSGLFTGSGYKDKTSELQVIVGENVNKIPAQFCYENNNVVSVEIKGAVTNWAATAFQKCNNLQSIVLGSKVSNVPSSAFSETGSLSYVKASANQISLGDDIFGKSGVSDVKSVVYDFTDVSTISITGTNKRPFAYRSGWVYVSNENTIVTQNVTDNSWIIVNGGAVDSTKTGFEAVYKKGYIAKWYNKADNSEVVTTSTPEAGNTYYAVWSPKTEVSNAGTDATSTFGETFDVSTLFALGDGAGTATYAIDGGTGEGSLDGSILTITKAGTFNIKLTTDETETHASGTATAVLTVNKADSQIQGDVRLNKDEYVYGDIIEVTVPAPVIAVTMALDAPVPTAGQMAVYNENNEQISAPVDAVDGSYTMEIDTAAVDMNAKAEAYKLKAKFVANDNLKDSEKEFYVTINQITPNVNITVNGEDSVSMRGRSTVELTVTGVPEDHTVDIVCNDAAYTLEDKENGTYSVSLPNRTAEYTFTAVYAGDVNHQADEDNCTVNVKKKSSSSNDNSSSSTSTKNEVSTDKVDNGSIKLDNDEAKKGDTVTFTVKPDKGFEVDEVTVIDKNGNEIKVKDNGDGTYSFIMPASEVEIDATFEEVKEETPAEETKPAETPAKEGVAQESISLTIGSTVATVDGTPVVNDVAPIIRGERTMLPVRFVAEALGATVGWSEAEGKVTITKGDVTIEIFIGQPFALVNGQPVQLDAPAFIENDRTYLPLRFVAETLGATVNWDGNTNTVTIIPNK